MVPGLLAKGAVNEYLRKQISVYGILALYHIVMAAVIWGHQWSKKRIIFKCDNLGTVHILYMQRKVKMLKYNVVNGAFNMVFHHKQFQVLHRNYT